MLVTRVLICAAFPAVNVNTVPCSISCSSPFKVSQNIVQVSKCGEVSGLVKATWQNSDRFPLLGLGSVASSFADFQVIAREGQVAQPRCVLFLVCHPLAGVVPPLCSSECRDASGRRGQAGPSLQALSTHTHSPLPRCLLHATPLLLTCIMYFSQVALVHLFIFQF